MNDHLFGTDGIRGRANAYPIPPEVALHLGKAIAHVFDAKGHGTKRALFDQPSLAATLTACNEALATEGRVIVRYSGTENLIRLRVEARTPDLVDAWMERLIIAVNQDLRS